MRPRMYAGLVDADGKLQLYDGGMRFVDAAGNIVVDQMAPQDYSSTSAKRRCRTRT